MGLSSCKTTICYAIQELSNILWNSKVHCHVQKSPELVPILSQINTIHKLFVVVRYTLTFCHLFLVVSFLLAFYQIQVRISVFPCVLHSHHLIFLDLFTLFILEEEYNLWHVIAANTKANGDCAPFLEVIWEPT
jgi:hypothetical protein